MYRSFLPRWTLSLYGAWKAKQKELQRKLQRLAREFNDLNNDDAGLPLDDRQGVTMVLALRHWHYGVFAKFRAQGSARAG